MTLPLANTNNVLGSRSVNNMFSRGFDQVFFLSISRTFPGKVRMHHRPAINSFLLIYNIYYRFWTLT